MRVIAEKVCGASSAAPTPCAVRAAISISMDEERPHHTDATVKSAKPTR